MLKGASLEGAPECSAKLAKALLRASMGKLQSAFPFSARWRSSHDCCAVIGVFHGDEDIGPAFRMVIVCVMSVPHISLTLSVMIVPSCGLASVRPTRSGASKPFSRITRRNGGGSRERNKSTGKQRPRPGIRAAEAKDQVSGSHHGRIHGRTTGQKVDLRARTAAGGLTCRPGLC